MTRCVAAEAHLPRVAPRLGAGWAKLLVDLNRRLWAFEPPARAVCRLGSAGLATVVLYDPVRRPATRALCDEVERRLAATCEHCGRRGTMRPGVIVWVACDQCAAEIVTAR